MRPVSGRELAQVLEHHGWHLVRIQSSHHIYGKDDRRERLSIPIHGSKPLRVGLLSHLMKVAGLTEQDFS